MRPERLVVVAGTATEIGKTWVAARLIECLRDRGCAVAVRKPAQSFDAGDEGSTDADVLAAAAGVAPGDVCPPHRWYAVPMAPPMAAEHLGEPRIALQELIDELTWNGPANVALVETAGGVRSPIAHNGDTVDLVVAIDADLVVLVADAGLGTVNAVRTSAAALRPWPCVVVLNRFDAGDELHQRNLEWLHQRDGFDVVTTIDELADAVLAV